MKYLYFFIILFCMSCSITDLRETWFSKLKSQKEIEKIWNTPECFIFEDFSSPSEYRWGIVNDWVMWGKSRWSFEISENRLVFSGMINTNGGGFSSLRGNLETGLLSDYSSVSLTARSDGREYKVTFRDSNNSRISHQAVIPFQNPWELETVSISFDELETTFFWQNVSSEPFQKEKAQQIWVIIADWIDWAFRLEIEEVKFCR